MKNRTSWLALGALACSLACKPGERKAAELVAVSPCEGMNAITDTERAAGWELLFDGKGKSGWHGYNGQGTEFWAVDGCALKSVGTEGNYGSDKRADLVTDAEYTNFELTLDWKASKGGNSGVMYGVKEDPKYDVAWKTGPEYQLIDDVGFPEKLEDYQKAGAELRHVRRQRRRRS